jgi:DNA-directed RNA polymerase specialized sigma subunit
MSIIDDQIKELEARLAELEPVLQEVAVLRESLESLQAIRDRDVVAANPPFQKKTKRPYLSFNARKRQITEVLKENPEATNAQIAERLGITAARVGQIRQQM